MTGKLLDKPKQNFNCKDLILEEISMESHEAVWKVFSKSAGLRAIIALHNTSLGFALGGIRIQPYASFEDALTDVLRLSEGMTYKSAIAGVGFGGGKSVIIADPKKEKTEKLLLAFGEAVDSLKGKYVCAEDVACTTEDVRIIRKATRYVVGLPHAKASGSPSPFTAWGIFRGIQSAVKKINGCDSLENKKIAVQGLGSVGRLLVDLLFWAGADLIISDIDMKKTEALALKYGAKAVTPSEILSVECDVLSPCALGGILNEGTIGNLRCKAIAGAANNQLLKKEDGDKLRKRGILYAPDFVINAGGLLNVATEIDKAGYDPLASRKKTHGIYDNLLAIYEIAERKNISTHEAAIALAEYRIQYGIGKRTVMPFFHHS